MKKCVFLTQETEIEMCLYYDLDQLGSTSLQALGQTKPNYHMRLIGFSCECLYTTECVSKQ